MVVPSFPREPIKGVLFDLTVPFNDVASVYTSFDKHRGQNGSSGTGSGTGSGSASGTGSPAKAKKPQEPKKVDKKDSVAVEAKPKTVEEAAKKVREFRRLFFTRVNLLPLGRTHENPTRPPRPLD